MNQLIRQFARRAGLIRMKKSSYAPVTDEQLENLIKLLVKECAGKSKSKLFKIFEIYEKK
jgi:hypothetical protein